MPSAAPTARSQEAKPKERRRGKPAPASASSVLSVPAMGLLRQAGGRAGISGWDMRPQGSASHPLRTPAALLRVLPPHQLRSPARLPQPHLIWRTMAACRPWAPSQSNTPVSSMSFQITPWPPGFISTCGPAEGRMQRASSNGERQPALLLLSAGTPVCTCRCRLPARRAQGSAQRPRACSGLCSSQRPSAADTMGTSGC